MEAGTISLKDLMDITSRSSKVQKTESLNITEDLIQSLTQGNESFLSILENLAGKGINLEDLVDLLKEKAPSVKDETTLSSLLKPFIQGEEKDKNDISNTADIIEIDLKVGTDPQDSEVSVPESGTDVLSRTVAVMNVEDFEETMYEPSSESPEKGKLEQTTTDSESADPNNSESGKMISRIMNVVGETMIKKSQLHPSQPKPGSRQSKEGQVGSQPMNSEGSVEERVLNPTTEDVTEKGLHFTESAKDLTRAKEGAPSLGEKVESTKTGNDKKVGSEPEPVKNSFISKEEKTLTDNLVKQTQHNAQDRVMSKPSPETSNNTSKPQPDSDLKNGQEYHLKGTIEKVRHSTQRDITRTDSMNSLNFQKMKISDDINISQGRIYDALKNVHGDSKNVEKERFVSNMTRDLSVSNPILDPDNNSSTAKTSYIKLQTLNQEMAGNKVIKIESASGEESLLSSNQQFSEKSAEVFQSKESQNVPPRTSQPDVISQFIEKAVLSLKNGQTSIRINLKPEELGQLKMQVKTDSNLVMIKILTETPVVKDIIENNLAQLKAELHNQGLQIDKFDVTVDQGQQQGTPKDFNFKNRPDIEEDDDRKMYSSDRMNKETNISKQTKTDSLVDYFA